MSEQRSTEKKPKPTYNPEYEKKRKQKPMSFSYNDPVQVRLLDFIEKFEYGTYFKRVLEMLSTSEQERIIKGDFLTIPLEHLKHNITASGKNVSHFFSVNDAVKHFDHDEIASQLSDDALLKELANRNLVADKKETVPYPVSHAIHPASQLFRSTNQTPVVNEFGTIEITQEDGTKIFLEPEQYLEQFAQN